MQTRKLKIAFLDTLGLRYNGDTLKEKGLGGSESAIIFLGEELTRLGFEVTVFNKCDREGVYSGVRYFDLSRVPSNKEDFDILITSRTVLPYVPIRHRETVLQQFPNYDIAHFKPLVDRSAYKVMWLHDTFILGEMWVEDVLRDGDYDEVFTLSDWHTQYIANARHGQQPRNYESMKRKFYQTRNGIRSYRSEVDIAAKDKNLFVYNASTTKGMVPLLDTIWPRVRAEFPQAKLTIIGGYYPGINPGNKPDQIETIWRNKYAKHHGKDGINFTGIIRQDQIADILVKASYFIYPGAFPETFGISATEALNYNVPLIATRFGALEETAPEATSYLIDYPITRDMRNYNEEGSVADAEQADRFMEIVRQAYSNDYLRQQKMYAANEFKPYLGWDTVALQWKEHFFSKLGMYMGIDEKRRVRELTANLHRLYRRKFYNLEDMIEDYSHLEKREIAVVSPVYNAENYISRHIVSVAAQNYDNYHHYIIDDLSTDRTVEVAMATIESLPKRIRGRFTIVRNDRKKYAVGNQYETISSLKGDPIVALLDGDDALVNDPEVFNFINKQYAGGARFTYGSCHSMVDKIDLIAQPYPKSVHQSKSYRKHMFNWVMPYTHLRTFEKSLFDEVDPSVFKDPSTGNYWRAGGDNSTFYPLIERCEESEIRAIQRVLVLYNDVNPLNDYKVNAEEQNRTMSRIVGIAETATKEEVSGLANEEVKLKSEKRNDNLLAIDRKGLEELRKDHGNEKLVSELKDILANREDVWIDSPEALSIKIRTDWLKRTLSGLPRESKILDIGSWTGTIANEIYGLGFKDITCLDISEKVVEMGRKTFPHMKWVAGDAESFSSADKYDIIIMSEIMEHLVDLEGTISKVRSMLSDGGFIVFTTPTEEFVFIEGSHEHITKIDSRRLDGMGADHDRLPLLNNDGTKSYEWYVGTIGSKPVNRSTRVLIAFPTAKNIETDTFLSIYRLRIPQGVATHLEAFYGYNIDQVRNLICYYAIQNRFDYVLFVDSDMILPADTLERLMAANMDIVTGIYIQRKPGQRITEVHVDGKNVTDPKFFEGKKVVQADSVGFGCVLIRTKVLADVGYPQFVYKDTIDFRDTVSEDAYFCAKARSKGYKINVLTDLLFEHIASIKLKW